MPDIGVSKDALRAVIPLTGEFVGTTDSQTLTTKNINATNNTITDSSIAVGDILHCAGSSKFTRLAMGAANKPLVVNSGATDVSYATLPVAGGGTGAATLTGILKGSGTSAITAVAAPTGAIVGDTDTQNLSGKTFLDQGFKLRNPAATQTLTFRNPAITSSVDYRFQGPYAYYIFKEGATFYAKNGITKGIDYSGADCTTVLQSAVTNATNGGMFIIADPFTITNPISIPDAVNGSQKPFWIMGKYDPSRAGYGTVITASSAFPSQRYMFESLSTTGTRKSTLFLENLFLYNPNGVGLGGTDLDVGGIKYEQVGNIGAEFKLRNIKMQYMWRGISAVGYIYRTDWKDIYIYDSHANFVGDCDVRIEQSTYADDFKINNIVNLQTSHQAGSGGGTGKMKNSLYMEGGYNNFYGVVVDGWVYSEAPIYIKNSWSNNFFGLTVIDLNANPTPDTRVAAIVLDGASTFDNKLYGVRAGAYPYTVKFLNSALRNIVEISGYFESGVSIDDAGSHAKGNTVIIGGENRAAASATAKITTTTANKTLVIDNRFGAKTAGTSTQSGNASTKIFNIAHGCFAAPGFFSVWPTSADATGSPTLSADATNIIVTYPVAPASGTNNLSWEWKAEVTYA